MLRILFALLLAVSPASAQYINSSGSSGLTVGTTTITGGTSTRILYDNAGVLGEYTLTGSGTVAVMQTSPSLITPALGVATGTSIALNGATLGTDKLAVTGTTTLNGAVTATGINSITNTTDSTTTTSGSLQVAGGVAIRKRVFIDGITTSAGLQQAVLCQSSGGEMIADSVACLASSARFKTILGIAEVGAIDKLMRLPIHRWKYNEEGIFNSDEWTRERIGPTAEETAAIDPRLVGYDKDGQARNISTEQLLALTIQALQELKADNDNLRAAITRRAAIVPADPD